MLRFSFFISADADPAVRRDGRHIRAECVCSVTALRDFSRELAQLMKIQEDHLLVGVVCVYLWRTSLGAIAKG